MKNSEPDLYFYIGKGGVGKSTSSALAAVRLAEEAQKTLLVSMDPAHNQRDIFSQKFCETPCRVSPHLMVKEVDADYWIDRYLRDTQNQIKQTYRYQSAFNLQKYFKVMQFSPGVEEYALLLAFENIIHDHEDMDAIVFDMAPTALTLRFFSLPFVTLIWLEELLTLREKIFQKKEIISKIKVGKREIERDPVKAKLSSMIDNHRHLGDHFLSPNTRIHLVMNNDPLSFSEARRIHKKLSDISIRIACIVINKLQDGENTADIERTFDGIAIRRLPLWHQSLADHDTLRRYIQSYPAAFNNL